MKRALISVYDKTGLVEFARNLAALKIEIVSTGGTARLLREAGITVREMSDLTGWPEMLGGRVKTLHPKVHGGILFRRGNAGDLQQVAGHGILPVDLVVVNLYPFSATARKADVTGEELIENIDIGGPAMVRSAAKNCESVAVVTDPREYEGVAKELADSAGISLTTRLRLARKAFALTSRYDGEIAMQLERLQATGTGAQISEAPLLPEHLHLAFERCQSMRYGENPHQAAALYVPSGSAPSGLAGARQLQGKDLSYNNLVDLDAAWALVQEFAQPATAVIKHNNPCGVAEQNRQVDSYLKALACDPVSAFGGVMAFNRALDAATAEELAKLFVECVVAPGYEPAALEKLATKKNARLLAVPAGARDRQPGSLEDAQPEAELELKRISGGLLVQQPDRSTLVGSEMKVVSERAPSDGELRAMVFAWKVCKHVKSNAVVFAREGEAAAIGAGQMSRVDSVKIAVMKAQSSLAGTVVASDAFFPFPDGVEEAGKAGATAVIQPGGSVRDADVIAAANRLGIAMTFTGVRHFRH